MGAGGAGQGPWQGDPGHILEKFSLGLGNRLRAATWPGAPASEAGGRWRKGRQLRGRPAGWEGGVAGGVRPGARGRRGSAWRSGVGAPGPGFPLDGSAPQPLRSEPPGAPQYPASFLPPPRPCPPSGPQSRRPCRRLRPPALGLPRPRRAARDPVEAAFPQAAVQGGEGSGPSRLQVPGPPAASPHWPRLRAGAQEALGPSSPLTEFPSTRPVASPGALPARRYPRMCPVARRPRGLEMEGTPQRVAPPSPPLHSPREQPPGPPLAPATGGLSFPEVCGSGELVPSSWTSLPVSSRPSHPLVRSLSLSRTGTSSLSRRSGRLGAAPGARCGPRRGGFGNARTQARPPLPGRSPTLARGVPRDA